MLLHIVVDDESIEAAAQRLHRDGRLLVAQPDLEGVDRLVHGGVPRDEDLTGMVQQHLDRDPMHEATAAGKMHHRAAVDGKIADASLQ